MMLMRAFVASLVMFAFAVTGTANCALAQPAAAMQANEAAMAEFLPPCHEPAGDTAHGGHTALHGDDDCSGGAACIDCALASGLWVDAAFLDGMTLHGAPRLFVVKAASSRLTAHDPPPPRA